MNMYQFKLASIQIFSKSFRGSFPFLPHFDIYDVPHPLVMGLCFSDL